MVICNFSSVIDKEAQPLKMFPKGKCARLRQGDDFVYVV